MKSNFVSLQQRGSADKRLCKPKECDRNIF